MSCPLGLSFFSLSFFLHGWAKVGRDERDEEKALMKVSSSSLTKKNCYKKYTRGNVWEVKKFIYRDWCMIEKISENL